ncbi:MAG: group III truncated hemoglobin [Bacteroidetes bacterium]|nr:group III truncated hemoglobin [Bacteroidota bacterium]
MNDIQSIQDIKLLVDSFYKDVRKDATIGYIFNEIIGDDWSHHLPVMYNFWEMVLLDAHEYKGNPIQTHIQLDKKITLQPGHYTRWLQLWAQTVHSLFHGPNAEKAIKRAEAMLGLIRMKVDAARDGKSLI